MNESLRDGAAGRLNVCHVPGPGDQPPMLMIHGVTRRWQTFLPLFASLSVRREIFAFDARGHGKSDPTPNGYRVIDYVADVLKLVRDEFAGPVVLYGHSLGAMTAAAAAAELGDRVAALVMEDPPMSTMGEGISQTPLLNLFQIYHEAAKQKQLSIGELAARLGEAVLTDPTTGRKTRLDTIRDAAALRFAASSLWRLDPDVLAPIVASEWLVGYDMADICRRIKCPALLLQADPGAAGMLTDAEAQQMQTLTPNLTLVRLAGCSHNIHCERTTDLLNYVHTFLETIDS